MRLLPGTLVFVAALLLLVSPSNAVAATGQTASLAVAPSTATYSAKYNGMPISLERRFTVQGDSYRVTTEARNFLGSIREEETFKLGEDGNLQPFGYDYKRSILGNKRSERSRFQDDSATITNHYKGSTVTLENPGAVLGPLSYQVQMQRDLMAGAETFTYSVVTRGRIKDYRYQMVGEETLETPLGPLETLVMERVRDDEDRETHLWLAEKLQFLPVKLRQKEDGESYEMLIKSYTQPED